MAQLLEMLRMDQEVFQRFFLNQMQAGEPIFRTAVLPAPTGISEHAQRRDAGGYS